MARVVLIPTGSMEHAGLAPSLEQLFPGSVFLVEPPERHLDSFTSEDVTQAPVGPVPRNEDKLAARLVAAVDANQPPDFACVIEDLELKNDSHPDQVVKVFLAAVQRHLDQHPWPSQQRRQRAVNHLREFCSFHLFRPMTEAYFFGDHNALVRAKAVGPAQLLNLDLEQFQTTDAAFLQLPPDPRPKKKRRLKNMPERQRHPKSYLHYLCDPTLQDKDKKYRETVEGVAALRELDWAMVLSAAPYCPFLHAFLDDLAESLNQPLAFVNKAHANPLLRFPGGQGRVLRNC